MYLAVVLAAVALVSWALQRVAGSPFGRVLRPIREDETVAAVAGKPVFRFNVQAFAIGAAVAGRGGPLRPLPRLYRAQHVPAPGDALRGWPSSSAAPATTAARSWGSVVLLGLLEGSRFAKDVISFLTGMRLAAAQQMLVGIVLVALMVYRPEGLLPERRE